MSKNLLNSLPHSYIPLLKILDLQDKNRAQEFASDNKATKLQKKLSKDNNLYKADHWYCAYCTFANPISKKKCDVCEKDKKVLKGPVF